MDNMLIQSNIGIGKKVIIVFDKKTEPYATFLKQLISQTSDINAAIFSEKQYLDSISTISSNNYIILIGNSKGIKQQRQFIDDNDTFTKFGMHYGWLGKQAYFYVDSSPLLLSEENYKRFIEFMQNYKRNITKSNRFLTNEVIFTSFLPTMMENDVTECIAGGIISATAATVDTARILKKRTKEQYQCLTLVFYQDALYKFLEIEAQS